MRCKTAILILTLGLAAASWSQQPRPETPKGNDDLIMLQEITIQVQPEQPTVIVTIPRQNPDIKPVGIQSPLTRMVAPPDQRIKPDLNNLKVKPIEESQNILAKDAGQ
ncbi:MAG: hypothetical protein V2A61_03400 [Calditrichota bacterium]